MTIGEVVEVLIRTRDRMKSELYIKEDEAICEACNILAKLPNMEEAIGYEPIKDRVL